MNKENNDVYIDQKLIEEKLANIEDKLSEHNKKFDKIFNILFFRQNEGNSFQEHKRKNS